MNRRAVSPVIGLVLLIGIVAIGSMGIFLAGTTLAENTQSAAADQQAERSMAQLAESGDQLATGAAQSAEFSIRGADDADVYSTPDAGQINVTVTNRTTGTQIFTIEESLGAVIYERADGSQIAYQGGGIWRKWDDGSATLVRTPEFHYRKSPDPTITFPISFVRDEFSSQGDTDGRLHAQDSKTYYPDAPNHHNPLRAGSVLINIESEYCEGWESYFEHHTDGSAAEDCSAGTEDELVIQFSVPFELDGLGRGVMVGGSYSDGELEDSFDIDPDNVTDSTQAPSATPLVEEKLEEAKDSGRVLPDDGTIDDSDLYYDDGNLSDDEQDTLEFDTSDGDIEIATDQPQVFYSQADVDIVGDNNVSVYATSNAVSSGGGSGEIGTYGKASQLRVFFHSDVEEIGDKGQNTDFHGLIYAPNSNVNLFTGDNNASGALVAEEYDFGNTEMEIDPDLQDLRIYETVGDAPFYYLHISETVIEVDD